MKRLLSLFALVAIVFTGAPASASDLWFVANDTELNAALESASKGAAGSVAISERFYTTSAKRTKDRIRGLIAQVLEAGDLAVYFYGSPLDTELALELLDVGEVACGSFAIYVGKMRDTKDPEPRLFCGTGEDMSEQAMRLRIVRVEEHRIATLADR